MFYDDIIEKLDSKVCSEKYIWKKFNEEEHQKYKDVYKCYDEFVTIAAKVVKELSLPNNSISIAYVVNRLLYLGYFSYDKFSKESKDNIITNLGINVVNGSGCCRHVSAFTNDLLSKSNEYVDIFHCHESTVKRNLDITKCNANHVTNIIKYNDSYYSYDVYNEVLSTFITPTIAKDMNNCYYLTYMPYLELATTIHASNDIKDNIEKISKSCRSISITKEEYENIKNETTKNIIKNSSILKDFSKDTLELKKYIKDRIK